MQLAARWVVLVAALAGAAVLNLDVDDATLALEATDATDIDADVASLSLPRLAGAGCAATTLRCGGAGDDLAAGRALSCLMALLGASGSGDAALAATACDCSKLALMASRRLAMLHWPRNELAIYEPGRALAAKRAARLAVRTSSRPICTLGGPLSSMGKGRLRVRAAPRTKQRQNVGRCIVPQKPKRESGSLWTSWYTTTAPAMAAWARPLGVETLAPPCRYQAAHCVTRDTLYLHGGGGQGADASQRRALLWALDLRTLRWSIKDGPRKSRVAARSQITPDTGTSNLGFRCAASVDHNERVNVAGLAGLSRAGA